VLEARHHPIPCPSIVHRFEVTGLAAKPTAGILKDVVMLGAYEEAEVDSVADNPGLTLFHCHLRRDNVRRRTPEKEMSSPAVRF
jgi:FtsP/CotA-like multicopper oxidase with cupredoxin domain